MLKLGTGKQILDRIRVQFDAFITEEERLTAKRFASASDASSTTKTMTIVIAILSVIFGGVMATRITRGITGPVHKLASALGKVARGDLNQEIAIKSKDEIGDVARSFNRMVGELKKLDEDRQQAEKRLHHNAFYDALTGLPNRSLLH